MFHKGPSPIGVPDDRLVAAGLFPVFGVGDRVAFLGYQIHRVTRIRKPTADFAIINEHLSIETRWRPPTEQENPLARLNEGSRGKPES
jgi:hypothetical protein